MPIIKIITLSLIVAITCVMTGCSRYSENELERLDHEANLIMSSNENQGLDSIANLLLEKAKKSGNRKFEGKAHLYLSSYVSDLNDSALNQKLSHLDIAQSIAEDTANDTLLSHVYNQRGVWELMQNRNTTTSQYWFGKSIERAKRLKDRKFSIPAEMNMSEACRYAGDTLGISYDRELFSYAETRHQPLLRFLSGLHCAVYYADIVTDTASLRPYIEACALCRTVIPER